MKISTTFQTCFYAIALTACCLSQSNHVQHEGLIDDYHSLTRNDLRNKVEPINIRKKRDVGSKPVSAKSNSSSPMDDKMKVLFVNIGELKNFIREEISITMRKLVTEELEKRLATLPENEKCKCRGPKGEKGNVGLPGPPGIKGPPGKRGDKGLGLFFPNLKEKELDVVSNVSDYKILSCTFFGNPIPKTHWESPASNTSEETEINYDTSEITTYLHVRNISWEDRGKVTCFATSILGRSNTTGFLTVHAPPIVDLQSKAIFATIGATVIFPTCKVVSSPPAEIIWKRGFGKLPEYRSTSKNGTLQIENVKVADEGFYECIAKNYLGTATKIIQLRVRPLQFLKKPPFYVYESNAPVVLICSAFGKQNKMSGKWFNIFGKDKLNYTSNQIGDEFAISLTVKKSGKYQCSITDNRTNIESFSEVQIFNHEKSSILKANQSRTLGLWLRDSGFIGDYKLCWRGSMHGFHPNKFHELCDGKPNTITVFKSSNGKVFGGFSDVPWRSSQTSLYGYSSKSFIYSFNAYRLPLKVKVSNQKKAVCFGKNVGPCFGENELQWKHNHNRWHTARENKYKANIGKSYKSNQISVFGSGSDKVKDIEVFYLS